MRARAIPGRHFASKRRRCEPSFVTHATWFDLSPWPSLRSDAVDIDLWLSLDESVDAVIPRGDLDGATASATAVVVLTRNRRQALRGCLQSLMAWREVGAVIVVDNDGHDGTASMVRAEFPDVDLIVSGRNLGATGGRNLG